MESWVHLCDLDLSSGEGRLHCGRGRGSAVPQCVAQSLFFAGGRIGISLFRGVVAVVVGRLTMAAMVAKFTMAMMLMAEMASLMMVIVDGAEARDTVPRVLAPRVLGLHFWG